MSVRGGCVESESTVTTVKKIALAAASGVFLEGLLWVLARRFAVISPCHGGATNWFGLSALFVHMPAALVAEKLNLSTDLPYIITATAALFSAVAFAFISVLQQLRQRRFQFGLMSLMVLVAVSAVVFGFVKTHL